jgi:hypothetical protein
MARTVDEPPLMTTAELFFRLPDDLHRSIQGDDLFRGDLLLGYGLCLAHGSLRALLSK